jgi:adrenodoxin-NADP+ reductase
MLEKPRQCSVALTGLGSQLAGHPDYRHIREQVTSALNAVENSTSPTAVHPASVVVIGHGNVALDCARILAKGADQLYHTDIAQHALPVLAGGVAHVSVIGRRGHVQAAFTIKEVRELVNLGNEGQPGAGAGAQFVLDRTELDLGMTSASQTELADNRPRQRIDKLLREHASEKGSIPAVSSTKRVHLRFLLNPVRFEADDDGAVVDETEQNRSPRRLGKVVCERTRLEGEPGRQRAVGTGEYEEIPAQLAIVSVGYRGVPVPGLEPFFDDRRGTVVSEHGRVDPARVSGDGVTVKASAVDPTASALGGLYVTGWLKRGPSGIIGTNISDAKETVAAIIKDLIDGAELPPALSSDEVEIETLSSVLKSRGVPFVDWNGYQRIVQQEFRERRSELQPREKITSFRRQLEVANSP